MNKFQKNEEFNQEKLKRIIDMYHFGKEINHVGIMQKQLEEIYDYVKCYVYRVMWDNYSSLMKNPLHREDLIQEIWLLIFEEIDKYDYTRASITTFVLPRIKHVVSEYCSRNFSKTSVYYSTAMAKISGAINYCQHYGIEPSFDTIVKMTNLSEATVSQSMELIQNKNSVSYENLIESGYEHESSIKSPEAYVLEQEQTKLFNDCLYSILSDFDIEVIRLLIAPDDPEKKKASYREIAEKLNVNIPKVKRSISHITALIKNNRKLNKYFPDLLTMYDDSIHNTSMPVLDDKDFIDEQIMELTDFYMMRNKKGETYGQT